MNYAVGDEVILDSARGPIRRVIAAVFDLPKQSPWSRQLSTERILGICTSEEYSAAAHERRAPTIVGFRETDIIALHKVTK